MSIRLRAQVQSTPRLWVLLAVLLIVTTIWLATNSPFRQEPTRLLIGTGGAGGTYHALGRGLSEVLAEKWPEVDIRVFETSGSVENIRGIESGRFDLAFTQNDTNGNGNTRSLARLYNEFLHILVRIDGDVHRPSDLRGKKVYAGSDGSGTRSVALTVLAHFGIEPDETELIETQDRDLVGAITGPSTAAVFIVEAVPSQSVRRLLATGQYRFLSLGDGELETSTARGIEVIHPYLEARVLPERTYGDHPTGPIVALSVPAVLVASKDMSNDSVRRVTEVLFQGKVRLMDFVDVAGHLDEFAQSSTLHFPFHDGARAYYQRAKPPFLVRYAESLSFGLTMALALLSLAITAREWTHKRKKDRIDRYYVEIESISEKVRSDNVDDMRLAQDVLRKLRRRAFRDLVAEKLQADESFTIFQDYLHTTVEELDHAIAELGLPSGI